jgi:homoserine kinase
VTIADGAGGDDAWALALAAEIEGHPDNVAPCLLGGLTIAWTTPSGARAVRLETHPAVRPTVLIPTTRGATAHARAALPSTVPHADAEFNAGRSALLVHALTAAPELLLAATEDRLHQGYRAPAMPGTAAVVADLRRRGFAATVSGAGPSVLVLGTGAGDDLGFPARGDQNPTEIEWCGRSLSVSRDGARIL